MPDSNMDRDIEMAEGTKLTYNGTSVLEDDGSGGAVLQNVTLSGVSGVTNVDDTTIEISGEALRVKAGGIAATQLASDAVATAKILNANVTLAKLAAGITPSHVVKFVKLGSTITTTALAGLVIGDLVVRIIAADGTVTAKLCASTDTLPDNPEDADYIVVLRAAA